jgi:ferredoxin
VKESALVHWLDDNETLPQYRPQRPHVLRIGRGPVLVDNAETHANVGLIARYGARWFASMGPASSPGSTLASVTGAVARQTVLEVALGTPLREILRAAGADTTPRALLLGGYGGAFLDGRHVDVPYDNDSLRPLGASVGAGVIVVLPQNSCGVAETAHIVRWMAHESARQCGPCAFGLPALAEDLMALTTAARSGHDIVERLSVRAGLIEGRGACRHPDGVVRLFARPSRSSPSTSRRTAPDGPVRLRGVLVTPRYRPPRPRWKSWCGMSRRDSSILRVNPILCDGFGHCHDLAPDLVTLDEWGYPIIDQSEIGADDEARQRSATLAVRGCPRQALWLERVSAKP